MAFEVEHELHRRRLGRNVGLGLLLGAFVALVFGLTVVKVSNAGMNAAAAHINDGATDGALTGTTAAVPKAGTGG